MRKCAVIGLGYVGLPLAVALSKLQLVFGYDLNSTRLDELRNNCDRNELVDVKDLKESNIHYTQQIAEIKNADFFIVAVPTPAYYYEMPDLEPLIAATKELASVLKKNDIVVYESTVYPGTTEEICIPLLEEYSHLKGGQDFFVGYSPERINPGDKTHFLKNIPKIISAQNEEALQVIQETYSTICDTLYPVSSIPIAEAIKVLENTQRDVNIALMNEFAKIMHALNLDMHEIIEGAKTKWSFAPYKPGFVGGHCISIDPHYVAFQAKKHGIPPDLILTARKINDGMTQFVIQSLMKLMLKNKVDHDITVGIFGISYKENTPDLRNSLALKLVKELKEAGFKYRVHDPIDPQFVKSSHSIHLENFDEINDLSVAIIVVGHDFYREQGLNKFLEKCKKPNIIMDIPNLFINEHKQFNNLVYWNL